MFEISCIWALALLPLPVLLYWWETRWRKRPSVVVSQTKPFSSLPGRKKMRADFPVWCRILALALIVLALARPRTANEHVVIRSQGIDIILALDMSGSMRAIDVPASITDGKTLLSAINAGAVKNRLDAAKEEIRRFIGNRPNDRIGLIGFSDLAYSFAPPTLDHNWLFERLDQLEPGMIGDATGIASPIGSAVSRLKNSACARRVLVLFTDGTNTAVNRLTPEQAADLAKEFSIIIHTVGIGSRNAVVLDNTFGSRFIPVKDNFDEALLKDLASRTGGTAFLANDAGALRKVMQEIDQLEKTVIEQPKYVEYREYAPYLALAAAVLILLALTAEHTWKLKLP